MYEFNVIMWYNQNFWFDFYKLMWQVLSKDTLTAGYAVYTEMVTAVTCILKWTLCKSAGKILKSF